MIRTGDIVSVVAHCTAFRDRTGVVAGPAVMGGRPAVGVVFEGDPRPVPFEPCSLRVWDRPEPPMVAGE